MAREPERLGWHGAQYPVEPFRDYLEALTCRLTKHSSVPFRFVLWKGDWPEDSLCEIADHHADIVIMTTRRHGWWSRFWRGSVSTEVARNSRTPVLLVSCREESADLSEVPAPDRILVPLDGSAEAERVLGPAVALAALVGGSCELLHVASSRPYAADWSLAYGGVPLLSNVDLEREARRYLRRLAARLRARSVPTRWRVVPDDQPTADAILHYAKLNRVDAIAMTGWGGGLSRLFRRRVAGQVTRLAEVPVLICRSDVIGLCPVKRLRGRVEPAGAFSGRHGICITNNEQCPKP